jgi:hypothetical protein
MPLIFAITFLFATGTSYATGSPSVLYLMGGEVLVFIVGIVWVLMSGKSWAVKGQACVVIFLGIFLFIKVNNLPDYLEWHIWFDIGSLLLVVLTIAMTIVVIRRG